MLIASIRLSCSLLFLGPGTLLHAQAFNWKWSQSTTSTSSIPQVMGFATDASGNSYVSGDFYGTATFGALPPLTSLGQSDVFVVKYDNTGTALWAVSGGGDNFDGPFDLALDPQGNVFLTGYIQSGTATFGTTALIKVGNMDIFVAKLNTADGSFAWAQRYGSNDFQAGSVEWGKGIACDADGNTYVTGCFRYTLDVPGLPQLQSCSQYYNTFLMKLDTDGNGLWSRRADCGHQWSYSASEGQAITVGADNMLYLGSRNRGDTLFYGTDTILNAQTSGQTHDGILAKYDLDGNYQWSRGIGGYGYDDVQAIAADADGNSYVAMHREGQYNLGIPNIDVSGNLGIYRNVILKYTAEGDLVRGTRMGNSTYDHDIEAMQLEDAGHLLVGGRHQGNFEIGGVTPNTGVSGTYGMYLARFDSSFALQDLYASRYQYPRGFRGIGLDPAGNIYTAGYFQDSLALPGVPVMDVVNSAMFLGRIGDYSTCVPGKYGTEAWVRAYPTPSSGHFTLESEQLFSRIQVVNTLGAIVLDETFAPAHIQDLWLRENGIYFYTLLNGTGPPAHGRVVIQH